MATVYIDKTPFELRDNLILAKGGEATIYPYTPGLVLKIYKDAGHPDFAGDLTQQRIADERIELNQRKLKEFPTNLPPAVITPQKMATDKAGRRILGYAMRFVDNAEVLRMYYDQDFREKGIDDNVVISIFLNLYQGILDIHKVAVIGDFNDLNVLVSGSAVYFIDADSYQFGRYFCTTFTQTFVDPLICDPLADEPLLTKPHNKESDWFAFNVMLFRSLLFVGPYGGMYRNPKHKIPQTKRALLRITVFDDHVIYPQSARALRVLPDDLLDYFLKVFKKDFRGIFPKGYLENLRWTKCTKCGLYHARGSCPSCMVAPAVAVKQVITVKGKVTRERIYKTDGIIVYATVSGDKLHFLSYEKAKQSTGAKEEEHAFIRDGQFEVVRYKLLPQMRFRICGKKSLIGYKNSLVIFEPNKQPVRVLVDSFGSLPIFDANDQHYYWTADDHLYRDDDFGSYRMGNVIAGQTQIWAGPSFGFGFYSAGGYRANFIFDTNVAGINDSVVLPSIKGQLLDASCTFTHNLCWFFISTSEGGKSINRCFVLNRRGETLGTFEALEDDGSWLGARIRGHSATGNILLIATDEGVIGVQIQPDKSIKQVVDYPDTKSFVNRTTNLFISKGMLYAVKRDEINLLKIS